MSREIPADNPLNLGPGDVLAFAGSSWTSTFIKWGSCSMYSHVGAIAWVDWQLLAELQKRLSTPERGPWIPPATLLAWNARHVLIESTTLADLPCEIKGRHIRGVQAHDPYSRIAQYPGRVWLLRVADDYRLSEAESRRFSEYLVGKLGLEYDDGGAGWSGGKLLKYFTRNYQDLHYVFCSELVAGALRAVGHYPMENVSKVNPGDVVETLLDKGLHQKPERVK